VKVMQGVFLVVFALISMISGQPAQAQKAPPKPSTTEPLHMYNANGQVVGRYLGWSCVSVLDGTQRVDGCFSTAIQDPNQAIFPFYYATVDCSGPGYYHVNDYPAHRDGYLYTNGNLIYANGPANAIDILSWRWMLFDGSFGNCSSYETPNRFQTAAPLKVLTVGPGPYTVK